MVRPRVLSSATLAASSCLRSFHLITLPAPSCRLHHSAASWLACRDQNISIPRPARCDERVTSRAAVTLCHTAVSRVTVSQLCQSSVPSWHGRLTPLRLELELAYQISTLYSIIPPSHHTPACSRLQLSDLYSAGCGCLAQMCATALHCWKACSRSDKM